jgi:phosphoenolpyruvate synthase/pyruvate phosphate dikinase
VASGVALSYAPGSRPTQLAVEAVFGLGEFLVSGIAEPDRWFLDRKSRSVLDYKAGRQVVMLTERGPQPVVGYLQTMPKLTSAQLTQIIDLTLVVESRLGMRPVDMEFCFGDEVLYALQARPQLGTTNPA